MKRSAAISAMGVGIIFVIVLGIVMIVSAPMLANKNKKKINTYDEVEVQEPSYRHEERMPEEPSRETESYRTSTSSDSSSQYSDYQSRIEDLQYDIRRVEEDMNHKIDSRMDAMRMELSQSQRTVRDKYVCSIVSYVDEQGQPISPNSPDKSKASKFVFECEYTR